MGHEANTIGFTPDLDSLDSLDWLLTSSGLDFWTHGRVELV